MNRFYCREKELLKLNRRYNGGSFECVIIYGRRRIGKTALINEFCRDKPSIFFSAINTTSQENLQTLSKAILHFERPGCEAYASFDSYDSAFSEITRLVSGSQLVFVIDEFPYLAQAYPSVSARLQHIIDNEWSGTKLFLILCGSSMSFMEHQVLGQESPLYGRRTCQFKLGPLDYRETALFNSGLTNEENALVYGITGGVPHYINKLGVKDNIDDALLENLFDSSGYLYEEPANLLKQELREPAIYNAIIKAIADGASRLNEICTRAGESSATTAKYVRTLTELGIVKKETPITEKPGKKTIYLLADQFFRFWYRFVPANTGAIESGWIARSYPVAIKKYFQDYMGLVFEKMCRDYLMKYADAIPIIPAEIGQWWGTDPVGRKQVQIDIIVTPAVGREYIIGSCKYRNEKTGIDELELMYKYAAVFAKGSRYHYYIFSKSGFTKSLLDAGAEGKATLVTLDDMYRVQTG